jgi:uncharacterized membrane protein YqgA involved in biofilm formation
MVVVGSGVGVEAISTALVEVDMEAMDKDTTAMLTTDFLTALSPVLQRGPIWPLILKLPKGLRIMALQMPPQMAMMPCLQIQLQSMTNNHRAFLPLIV